MSSNLPPENRSLDIAIVGAGAIGSSLGYFLKLGGADPWLVDPWTAHVEAINAGGLTVVSEDGQEQVLFRATTDPSKPGVVDVVILLTKANHLRDSVRDALPLIGPETQVFGLQNGLGHLEIISEVVPIEQILYGFCEIGGDLTAPGTVRPTRAAGLISFKPVTGEVDDKVSALVELLAVGGITLRYSPDIDQAIWSKLAINCSFNAACALTRLDSAQISRQPDTASLVESVIGEVIAVAGAKGISVDRDHVDEFIAIASQVDHHPSMAQDVMTKRRTEIESLNGAVVREAAHVGVPTPVNDTITRLVRILEATYAEQF